MKPYFVAFCGASGSGKTTLIEKLIPTLAQMGYRVSTLKHTAHRGHSLGDEGKDSDRLFKAGAQTSVFWCPEQMMVKKRPTTESALKEVETYFQDADIVLVEGLQNSSWPEDKILVIQKANPQLCDFDLELKERVMAVISSSPPQLASSHIPTFAPEDVKQIAEFIVRKLYALC